MRNLVSMIALCAGMTAATTADAGAGRWGEDLRFVSETSVPAPGSTGTMSLCHHIDYMTVFFVPVYTSIQGYALSSSNCTGSIFRTVDQGAFAAMQATGMVPTHLPTTASVPLKELLWGHAWLILGGVGMLFRGATALRDRGSRTRKSGSPDNLAIHALVAMSQVAVADGRIDDGEVRQIANILTRLTGQSYAPSQVADLLAKLNPSPTDLAEVGQDLSEKDCQIVLEAALNIAVADGDIHPNEYAVVSELAQRMRIGADQFRSAMARISAHLQTVQPA